MTTGFLVLSPNEVEQVLKKQYEDNRIRRLLEVRNLAKHHARVKREQFQNVKNQKNEKELKKLKRVWEADKENHVLDLKERYSIAMDSVGSAHKDAQTAYASRIEKAKKDFWEYNKFDGRMSTRFNEAMEAENQKAFRDQQVKQKQQDLIKYVKEMEQKRSEKRIQEQHEQDEFRKNNPEPWGVHETKFNDLDKVPKEEKHVKPKDNFSCTYHHMEGLDRKQSKPLSAVHVNKHVMKHISSEERSAKETAKIETERAKVLARQQSKLNAAREQRAFSRAQNAQEKEDIATSFDKFNTELENLNKHEIKKRLKVIRNRSPSVGSIATKQTRKDYLIKVEKDFEREFTEKPKPPIRKQLHAVYDATAVSKRAP